MAEPPSEVGASKLTVIEVPERSRTVTVGRPGVVAGVPWRVLESSEVPASLVAVTVKV